MVQVKNFFSSTFIKEELLKEQGIRHKIELEYYKIINEEEIEKSKYGIHVVKKEYKEDDIKVEENKIQYFSNDEKEVEKILNMLKEYEVTPIGLEDNLIELCKKNILI